MKRIGEVFSGSVNSVYIFLDDAGNYRTGWEIRDKRTVRVLLSMGGMRGLWCLPGGVYPDFSLPYREHRPLLEGRFERIRGGRALRRTVLAAAAACMTGEHPWPVLYLILKQRLLHIGRDGTVYFSYELDLEELDGERTQGDCVSVFLEIFQEMRDRLPRPGLKGLELIDKKRGRGQYESFEELCKDLQLVRVRRPLAFWARAKIGPDKRLRAVLLRLLLGSAAIAAAAALLLLAAVILFGKNPLWELFAGGMDWIGTEYLG